MKMENKHDQFKANRFVKFFEMDQKLQFNDLSLAVWHDYMLEHRGELTKGMKFSTRLVADGGIGYLQLAIDGKLAETIELISTRNVVGLTQETMETINELAEKMFREETDYGLKDAAKLDSILSSVMGEYFGYVQYPSVVEKASAIWYKIADAQCFRNGNKRTALLAGLFMLSVNGFELANIDGNQLYDISLRIARKEMKQPDVAAFIRENMTIKSYNTRDEAERLDTKFEIRFQIDKDKK